MTRTHSLLTAALATTGMMLAGPSALAATVFSDNFDGDNADALNGLAPDVAPGAETWTAGNGFQADGALDDLGGATLAFTPVDNMIYTLDVSYLGLTDDPATNDWAAMGFGNGTGGNGTNHRFTSSTLSGDAWMLMRGSASPNGPSKTHYNGTGNAADWADWSGGTGGDIDMRVVLDTTGGTGNWTATWFAKRPTDGAYTQVGGPTSGIDESINAVGFATSFLGGGSIDSFSLDAVPEPGSMALLGLGGLLLARRRRD